MSDGPSEELRAKLIAVAEDLLNVPARTSEEHDALRVAQAQLHRVLEILVARGVISAMDVKLARRYGDAMAEKRVRLAIVRDKHAVPSLPIDCAAHLHLCQARCCTFRAPLSPADVDEGKLTWDLMAPYELARVKDGYCVHMRSQADGGGCSVYDDRPAACREYDCRHDPRVWLDFEKQIPAPLPEGVIPRF